MQLVQPAVHSLIRFIQVGILVTCIHVMIVALGINFFHWNSIAANTIAFTVATAISYTLNTYWSFAGRSNAYSLPRYIVVTCVGFAISLGCAASAQALNIHYAWGVAATVATVPAMSFSLHYLWTYYRIT